MKKAHPCMQPGFEIIIKFLTPKSSHVRLPNFKRALSEIPFIIGLSTKPILYERAHQVLQNPQVRCNWAVIERNHLNSKFYYEI